MAFAAKFCLMATVSNHIAMFLVVLALFSGQAFSMSDELCLCHVLLLLLLLIVQFCSRHNF
jgi:hypothetical protein